MGAGIVIDMRLRRRTRDHDAPFSKKLEVSASALCYHSVRPDFERQVEPLAVAREMFEQHLVTLKSRGFAFLSIDEFLVERRRTRCRRITSVTFDDGFADVKTNALPVLEAMDIPFTIFIATSVLSDGMLWRDRVRSLVQSGLVREFQEYLDKRDKALSAWIDWGDFQRSSKGDLVNSMKLNEHLQRFIKSCSKMEPPQEVYLYAEDITQLSGNLASIGNHTHHHYRLRTIGREQQDWEIGKCQEILKSFDVPISNTFAIPFGENGSFDQDTVNLVQEHNFSGFLMTNMSQFGNVKDRIDVRPGGLLYSNRVLPPDDYIS